MLFNTGAALLDAIVLAVVAREPEGTYGYKVTSRGWAQLHLYESEWRSYSGKITGLFEGRPVKRSEA